MSLLLSLRTAQSGRLCPGPGSATWKTGADRLSYRFLLLRIEPLSGKSAWFPIEGTCVVLGSFTLAVVYFLPHNFKFLFSRAGLARSRLSLDVLGVPGPAAAWPRRTFGGPRLPSPMSACRRSLAIAPGFSALVPPPFQVGFSINFEQVPEEGLFSK